MEFGPETTVWESPTKRARVVEFGYTPTGGAEKSWYGVRVPEAVGILPVDDRHQVILAQQPRPVINDGAYLELVAGLVDPNELPAQAAARELREEVGLKGDLLFLGRMRPSPGILDECIHLYLALNLEEVGDDQDEDERIVPVRLSFAQLRSMIRSGSITDSKILAALLYAQTFDFVFM